MKNFLLFNQSFGTEGSPNQTGKTLTRENRIGLMSYLRRTLMLLLVAYIGIGQMWAVDPSWSANTSSSGSTFLGKYKTSAGDSLIMTSTSSWSSSKITLNTTADNSTTAYNTNYLQVFSKDVYIDSVSFKIESNGSNKDVQAPAFGWASAPSSNTADTYFLPESRKISSSYANAQWVTYDFSSKSIKYLRLYRATKYMSSTSPSYTGSSTVLGVAQTIGVYGIKVWLRAAGSCAATANAGADKETTVGVGVAMAATAASSGYTGAWSIKAGSPSTATSQLGTTSSNTMTFTPNTYGTYTLVWTVTDNEDGSCSATDEATVTVPAPTHSIAYTNLKGADNSANPTTYTEGVGVASFANLRHLVDYDFTEWSPSSISSSATTDQTIDAQWTARAAAAGTGTLIYNFGYSDNTITTSSITRNNGALYDATNLTWTGVTIDESESNERSGKITTTDAYNSGKYLSLTFKIADGYTFTPTEVQLKAVAVSNDKTIRFEFTDNAGTPNSKYLEQVRANGSSVGTLTYDFDASDPVTLTGTVTVKIYAYGKDNSWRLGTPLTITGTVASAAPSCSDDTGLAYGETTVNKTYGDGSFTNTLTNSNSLSVTYSSSNTNVATVNESTGAVTIAGAGTTTITATWAGNATYCADEVSYTLNVKPSAVVTATETNGWRYTIGEKIDLTCTATGGSSYTYQWQKYTGPDTWTNLSNGTDGGTFSGVTTNRLQISGCTSSNGGSYRCVVTANDQTKESNAYVVYIFTLDGNYDDDSWTENAIVWTGANTGRATINLAASRTYKFKVTNNDGKWFGCNTGVTIDMSNWTFRTNEGHCVLTTGGYGGGAYTFDIDISYAGDNYISVSVTYPKKTTYLQLCSDWKAASAKYAIYYWKSSYIGWTDFMTAFACDGDVLSADVPVWATNCIIGRFNTSKESTGNWDDKWNQTGDLTLPTDSKDYYHTLSKGGDEKYYGSWGTYSPSTYTITFAANGGSGSMSSISSIACDADQQITANSFTKTGYSFAGWKADVNVKIGGETISAGTVIANSSTIQNIRGNIALTAQWTEDKHSVTVAAGSNGTVSPSSVSNIGIATASGDITATANTGYHFTSWTLPSGTSAASTYSETSNPIHINATADDKTITANFSANTPTITLDDQDATNTPTGSVVATYGSSMPEIATLPTKTGYTFGGFYSDVAGGGTKYYNADGSSAKNSDLASATTLYALWTQSVTIDDNGGSADGSVSVTYKGSAAAAPSGMTYAGHTADLGFYTESSCTNKVMNLDGTLVSDVTVSTVPWTNASSKWVHAGSSTLYAHWKCNTPAITDNGNNTVTITVPSGTTVRYTTDGTDPSSSSGTVYSTTFSIAADCTVKAIAYQTNCTDSEIASKACDYSAPATLYTVTFNTNGGGSQSSITQASEGASITMPSAPTKAGNTFVEWVIGSTTKDASASYTPTANVTAYASWQNTCAGGGGGAASTTNVVATGYTSYQEKGGSNVIFTSAPSIGMKYKTLDGTTINNSTDEATHNNAYSCQLSSNSSYIGSIKTNSSYSNVDSISFYFAGSAKSSCKVAVLYSTDNFATDSTTLLSATAIASGGSNNEFYKKVLSLPPAKKANNLTFRFRFTTSSSGSTSYIDSLKIYTSAGGGGGTCYYVTYKGNGAATGFTSDTLAYNSSSSTVTVKANGAGGAAYAKSGNIFSGWNTKSDGTGTSFKAGDTFTISKDTILYAQWADPSSGDCFYIDDAKKKSDYSVSVGGTFDDTKLKGSITGGTVTNTSTESVSFSGNGKYGIIFDASTKKITVRLSSGTLKSGATIKIGGYTNNSKSQTCGFKVSGNNCSPASVATTSGNSSYNFFTQTYTVSAADGVIGTDSFSITLVDDKTYLDSLYVSGCDDCTEGGLSYATASLTKTICDAAFTNTLSNSNSLTGITYSSTNTSVATVESDGEVTIVGAGTTTIKATAAAQSTYCASEATYSLTVNSGTAAGLSFATASYSKATDDEGFTQTVTNPNSLTGVTYSSSNPSVATVNETTGAVTLVSTGSTTITASTDAQTVSTTCYAAGSASYTISVSGSASCTTLPDYIWKTGSTYTPVGTSYTYADGEYNEIDNDDDATTHISISGSNHVQKSGSLNIGKSKDNYFLITAASGYVIDSIYFYGKMEDGECRMTTDNSNWNAYSAGQTTEKAFAIGVGTQYFGIKNKNTDSPKGVWIRTMRIKVCSASAKYTVTYNLNGHGDAISATTNITPNTTISAPSAPSAECYTFGGWYKEAACTNVWTFASDKVTNNMTLYAKWTSNKAQVASTDYGKLVYTVTPASTADALSVTPVDATGVTYKWLEYTSDDVSSASAIDDATSSSYSPSIASVGTKYYWAVLVHDCGNDTTDAFRIVVNAAKTDPTIVWGNVKLGGVNTDPTYGGGGYTLTGTINAGNASTPTLTTDMITAGEGIVITSKSVNDETKSFSLTFGLTAAFDTTQAKLTDIHFELPGNATYNDSLFATNLDYDKCSSGSASTDVYVVGYTNSTGTSPSSSAAGRVLKVANTWRSTSSPTFTDKTSADVFTISATAASGTYWAQGTQTFVASSTGATMKTYKLGTKSMTITWTNTELSFSKVRIIGKNLGSAASTVSVSNGTTSENFTFENSSDVQVKEVSLDFTYGSEKGVRFTTTDAKELNVLIELVPTGSDGAGTGTSTALEWKSGKAPSDITGWDGTANKIVKGQADANFTVVAQQTSATNSLGAITYSSNNEEVATVNSTTGEVNIVAGASGGEATITAEMARSGCYKKATLSYIINVPAQACDIKAGSIAATPSSTISVSEGTATKCSTEAVTLTISGHTTSNTTVTWWKDGVQVVDDDNIYNIEGATLATKAEGTYNAKVTGATCAVATNNIEVVDRSASVSVTKLVNQWYIKNGRVTPDIPLFELGEGCSFVGAKADDEDLTDELGGCTVYQKAGSDTVFLQGKAPSGMTVGNVSLQIVVEDVCGNTETSAAITIHKQVATDKHELAFVVAGTNYAKKTFSEDAWTDGIKASQSTGLKLYQVLKDTFKIQATNIYATDSIPLIREYYSQFDLICITDYPNTGTKGKNGSSYVDAIGGAMIDVRPLLTMEAYVSGLDNWRAKGVIGSRTTPSERQYNMMLQCKDHEIFEGTTLKQFGYGDDALFRVNIVDSTAHGYVDLDATSKSTHASDTAALQGFTVGEMKDLLPLGTTDNGSGTDLQVGVERQKVMTARMMVLGINSYAMERLSKDGMQIVVNALQYLTKKRSEDISDCSSYFTNDAGDNKWENPLNWRSGTIPTSNQEARITQPVTVSDTRKIASVKIATDGTFRDAEVDGSLTVASTGMLIVAGKVQAVKGPDFMNGFATSVEDITIEASSTKQGALILNNEEGTTKATVQMYSKAGYDNDGVTPNFAYVGVPVSGMTLGSAFPGAEVWYYNESNPYWWSRCDDSETSDAHFLTYCISHWAPQTFELSGTLAPTGTQNFTLSVHSGGVEGDNMIANSWTAPIDIAQFEADDFDGAEATLYMYRTGHDDVRGTGEAGDGAGKWATVSVDAAKSYIWPAQLRMIPSMQAFCIEVDGTRTLTMDYDRLVRKNAYSYENGEGQATILAPKRKQAKSGKVDPRDVEGLRLVVSGETTGYDVYLFAHPGFSEAFDNGWDAHHMEGGEMSNPLLCVPSELGNLDIAAIPELAGRELKFVPSSEREYTFSMTYEGDNELYLNDIKLEKSTRIQTGNTYDFVWENGDGHNRFIISATPFESQVPTGVTDLDEEAPKARKIIYNDKMYIFNNGRVFDAQGKVVK